jgi:ligand-binding SRPBCC domain-containing protein
LFGFVPIDRHRFFLAAINPNEGFSERSTSWTNKYWCHERKVVSQESGCRVTDTVNFSSRIPFVDMLLKPIYRLVFRWRHRNLRRRYGELAS